MQKRIISNPSPDKQPGPAEWLNLEALAEVEITSEANDFPIEAALLPGMDQGWRAGASGKQTIRLLFKQAQQIKRIQLSFLEPSIVRTQEYVLRWSQDSGKTFEEIVRQQWNFSPEGANSESEDYNVKLMGVNVIELIITPDISGGDACASLAKLRLA